MGKIYLKDSKIRTHVANSEYRSGWDRIFGAKEDASSEVADEDEGSVSAGGTSQGAKAGKGREVRNGRK